MKRFIISILLFLLFLMVSYPLLIFVWTSCSISELPNLKYHKVANHHMHTRLKEVKNIKNVDILFLGSSHAYRGFDTRIFNNKGYTSFNLGSSIQTPLQTKLLLNRYLNQINPKTIIYEVYPPIFSNEGIESALDIIANDENDRFSIYMAFKVNHIKVYNLLIYTLMKDLFNLNASYREPMEKDKDTYISGGFVERKIQYYKKKSESKDKKFVLNEDQSIAFNEIKRIAKEKNIELILVYAPVTSSLYYSYSNNQVFDSIMTNNSRYYNFNKILSLNDSLCFYDSDHLNQNGVKIFDNKLIELIDKK
jgi:hypothetical protein